jgi:Ca2+-transporting ATPase
MQTWWKLNSSAVVDNLQTDLENGLNSAEVANRITRYGRNQLKKKRGRNPLLLFLSQFTNFIVLVLMGAALISLFLALFGGHEDAEWIDSMVIFGIIIVNAILGFSQEFRAEQAISALKKLSNPTCRVTRNSETIIVPSSELVPGDVVELEAGDNIPADGRVVSSTTNFATVEGSLTGESTPVEKKNEPLNLDEVELADRVNMVYMGTSVVAGKGKYVVCETGMQTELGKIAGMIQEVEIEPTPLQEKLEKFGRWIIVVCLILVTLIFVLGLVRGKHWFEMFMTSVSLAVAAIPEGLPAVVTIALALGVQRMIKRNALIRKLPSVETLGSTTVICTDKTGTLTRNEMTVKSYYTGSKEFVVSGTGYEPAGTFSIQNEKIDISLYPDLEQCLVTGLLCNGAELVDKNGTWSVIGDPTEGCLLTAAVKGGFNKENMEEKFSFVSELPFDSVRKRMTIIRNSSLDDEQLAFVKGAPDVLLEQCTMILENGKKRPLSTIDRQEILNQNNMYAENAMRVLGLAVRAVPENTPHTINEIEQQLTFIGLTAMIDPPRPEAKEAISQCKNAGIRSVMITGDHKITASAIAAELGFFDEKSRALSGQEIDGLDENTFKNLVPEVNVFARVSPEHKLRIVGALEEHGEIVAMTGDGVNDAPALKEADIGIAMGITGTDVTKEVSDMVITDDNFTSIVSSVEEGRGIFANIQKFIHFLLSCNAGEIFVMFIASLLGWPAPLLPVQILWVNLVTDGFPALALGVEKGDPGIMNKPPRPVDDPIIKPRSGVIILLQGLFMALLSLAAFWYIYSIEQGGVESGIPRARTFALLVLACGQLFHSFNCRDFNRSIFSIGIFSNMKLIGAVLLSYTLQIAVIYIPFTAKLFKLEALSIQDLVIISVIAILPLVVMELVKLFFTIIRKPVLD